MIILVGPFQFRKFNESMVVKMNLFSDWALQVLVCGPSTAPCCSQTLDGLQYSTGWDLCSWIGFPTVASLNHFLSRFLLRKFPSIGFSSVETLEGENFRLCELRVLTLRQTPHLT